jgi:hypothetical protein
MSVHARNGAYLRERIRLLGLLRPERADPLIQLGILRKILVCMHNAQTIHSRQPDPNSAATWSRAQPHTRARTAQQLARAR